MSVRDWSPLESHVTIALSHHSRARSAPPQTLVNVVSLGSWLSLEEANASPILHQTWLYCLYCGVRNRSALCGLGLRAGEHPSSGCALPGIGMDQDGQGRSAQATVPTVSPWLAPEPELEPGCSWSQVWEAPLLKAGSVSPKPAWLGWFPQVSSNCSLDPPGAVPALWSSSSSSPLTPPCTG